MIIIKNIVFIIIGFILLIKGADYFVDGSVAIAERLKIPQIIVGLTIVAFGTSAPEAAVSISSSLGGNPGIAIGNVLGSNVMNILLILGLTSMVVTLKIQDDTIKVDIPVLIFSSVILPILGLYFGSLNIIVGCIFWIILISYITYLVIKSLKSKIQEEEEEKKLSVIAIIIYVIGGMAAIVIGSNVAVEGATGIAEIAGVSQRVIGLTIVAFGTSLPELMTSLTAARKGEADIAIGNIVGSNLFNILFILGTTSIINAIPFGTEYIIDSVLGIVAAVLLFVFSFRKKCLNRVHGIIFLVIYAGYLYYLLR